MPILFLSRSVLLPAAGVLLVGACFALQACGTRGPEVAGLPERVDFNFHVKPILSDRCFKCHGPDDRAREAELRLDTDEIATVRGESGKRAVVPGRPSRSELVRRILSDDPTYQMPPTESHLTLSDYERAVLVRWVDQGARWEPHWSFSPPERAAVPDVASDGWPRSEIDRFILARLEDLELRPAPEAAKETWLRRVRFDLTGLPPSPEEIDAFLSDDAPSAYEKVVDRLLASPAYGERMATEWLDLARYADSHGYQDDGMREMWPWRDWVIRAFNENMPYDRFLTWQLAGDLLPNATQDQILATGFNRNHMQSQEGGIVDEEYRVEYVADRVNTLGRAVLGLTLECARCHDHKYDPVTQREYFQVYDFFNNINEAGNIPYSGVPSPTVILIDSTSEDKLAGLEDQIAAYEAKTSVDNAAFDEGYARWVAQVESGRTTARLDPPGLIGHYTLDEMRDLEFENLAGARKAAVLGGDPESIPKRVDGRHGGAQRLVGSSYIDLGPEFAFFERNEPFSISFWMRIEEDSVEGPLFSRSGGLDDGNRGYDVMLGRDGLLTAGLYHVAPANGIEIRSAKPVTPRQWHHLVMTYDGSSRAGGLRLYLDGQGLETRIVTDHLKRSIIHDGQGGNWGAETFRIGKLFGQTVEDVSYDEFRVFGDELTYLEVMLLYGDTDPLGRILAVPSTERTAAQLRSLRDHYVRRVAASFRSDFARLTALRGEENEILSGLLEVMVMGERTADRRQTYVLNRGAYDAPGEPVEAGTPAVVGAFPDSLPKNRLGLAKWLVNPAHPLTARVAVNRLWHLCFGRGLVATPGDFGSQGELPSHPELLDWLAIRFVDSGWDVKAMLKEIVLSATYRQSSLAAPSIRERDPENVWLARGPSHRLSAEQIRDNALAASGLLVREIGGPSVKPYQPEGLWEELATRNATTYEQDHGDKLYRRSLYTIWKRTSPPPSMTGFDAAERLYCTVQRQRTNTPLQALILMNDPQYVEAARLIAERMVKEGGAATKQRIAYGFRLLTGRLPLADEATKLEELYRAEHEDFRSAPDRALDLLSVGEYSRDETLDPAETAALAIVASTILNFDETVMKR